MNFAETKSRFVPAPSGPLTLSEYEKPQSTREVLGKEGIRLPTPAGN